MVKNIVLAILVCANLGLLAGIVLQASAPSLALAQATGLAGNYLAVAGEIRDQYDALYLLDVKARRLHAFYYDVGRRELTYVGNRDLERDIRHNRD